MSWLYTLVFSSLLFSTQNGVVPTKNISPVALTNVEQIVGDETEKFEQSYPLSANGRVNVSNINGSITVEAWDRNEVKLEYTKVADKKERLADVEIRVESRADYFSAEADDDNWKARSGGDRWRDGGKLNVEFKLMVPRGAVLRDIETVNGSVTVSNFTNTTRISAVNGSVNATNIRGTATLSTVNGEVNADFERLETGTKISLETVNGRVNLTIPSDSAASLRAESLNGNITNDFGLPVNKGKYVGRDLYGRLGSGDVQIKLESVNGPLSIKRRNDGKPLSPTTNLLPNKDKDDENWDDESIRGSSKKDREIARAARVEAAAALKAAAKESAAIRVQLKDLEPEIAKITAESAAIATKEVANLAKILSTEQLKSALANADMQMAMRSAKIAEAFYFPTVPNVESKSGRFTVKGKPKVTIVARGCSVTVRGWDKSEVQYRIVQFADPRNRKPVSINEEQSDSSVKLSIVNPDESAQRGDFSNDRNRVRIEIFVPRHSNIKIDSNGEIRLDGVNGEMEVTGADESMNIRDVEGTLKVANNDGRVRIIGFRGELETSTADGDVFLEGDFAKLQAYSQDGNYYLTVPVEPNLDIKANHDALRVEDLRSPNSITENHWRFGNGGPSLNFNVGNGEVVVRSLTTLNK